jgi:HlyD family secretion protein
MSEQLRTGAADLERLRILDADRRGKRHRRRWPYVLLGLLVLVVALVLLGRPTAVQVTPVRAGGGTPAETGGTILTANGYVEARHQASVAARTTGRLAEVRVEEGDRVDSGTVVARLIDEDQRSAVAQMDANLALSRARLEQSRAAEVDAERRLKRRNELLGDQQISQEEGQSAETAAQMARADRAAAEAAVKVAGANLESARLELDKTRITAPFSGVVLRKDAEVGEIVGPIMTSSTARAGAVVTIADLKTLEVGVDVNESYIARLNLGMPADIVLDAYPEVHFPAEIRAIFPSADRDKATIPVRIRFLVEDPRIRPDLGAKVSFLKTRPTTEITTVPKTLRLPASALRPRGDVQIVWMVRNGKTESATVTVGRREGDEVEILSGLNEGDQVVADAGARIRPGMRVRPISAPKPQANP